MEFKESPQSSVPAAQSPKVLRQASPLQPVDPMLKRHAEIKSDLQAHTSRPASVQRLVAQPALRAASLHTGEVQRLVTVNQTLQREAAEFEPILPEAITQAVQRKQQEAPPIPLKPQSVGDWVTVMRFQAEQAQGRRMQTREAMQYTALQRQVANTIAQGFRQDRQTPSARHQQYAGHLATLQRFPASAPVAAVALQLMPAGERPAVQRALDKVLQHEAEQQARDAQALKLYMYSIQRQLDELEQEATRPVMQRIQARRGSGNPLPAAVQRHLEKGLNHDLSSVRIHDDQEADKLAKKVSAIAFTTGTDIFFQSGKFNPNTQTGLELLAHEVTHTVQQGKGQVGKGIDPDSGLESEAQAMGRKLASRPVSSDQRQGRTQASGNLKTIGKQKPLAPLQRSLSIQRALPVVAVWIGKTIITGSIDNFIDYAISVLLGLPAPGFWDKAGNFAINAVPGAGEAKKVKKAAELSSAIAKLLNALHELEKLGDAGKTAAALIRKRAATFESAAKSGNLNAAQTAWKELVESIQNGHLVKARQLNLSVFQGWAANGLSVAGRSFKVNPHFLNTLKKGGRKDTTPDDVLGALRTKPSARMVTNGVPGVTYTNPSTGLRVHVNPDTTELVGVWPKDFK